MTGQEAIDYIHSMTWNRRATGYEHAKLLLEKMGNPEKRLKYVHIGGTNGKGSTAAMVASVLQKAGYKTGLYTSPYIFRFHERMQINGEEIEDDELASVTEYVKSIADTLEDCPSEFALVCCIAFEYFARNACDIVVLEVGMGGANDSTNVIDCPEVAILTNIGLDHTEYLGNTLEEIAETKAGIIKQNGTAVIYRSTPSVERVIRIACEEKNTKCIMPSFEKIYLREHSLEGQRFDYKGYKDVFLSLLGHHQLCNAAVVIEAIDVMISKGWKINEAHLRQGFANARWPGRFEVLSKDPLFIVDGGHNPQCMEALVENIKIYLAGRRVIAITGVLEDKDYVTMYQPLLPYVDEFLCITPPSPRKMDAARLAENLCSVGASATAFLTVKDAIKQAIQLSGEQGAILCFGSLYSIHEIQEAFQRLR